jgi:hypothetical protein
MRCLGRGIKLPALKKLKAIGERGSWFAKVNGERLPCCHKHLVTGQHHSDPGYIAGIKQWDELIEGLNSTGRVILTKDEPRADLEKKSGMAFKRIGYIAVFKVANVVADEISLRFDLTGRLHDLV